MNWLKSRLKSARSNFIVRKLLKSYDVNPKALRKGIAKYMVNEGKYTL